MVTARQAMFAMAFFLPAGIVAQGLVGTFTSSASVVIGEAEMRATAAASWPVVDGDEIASTKAPALLTTTDRNLVTFERESKARVRAIENGQAFIYLRQGGVLFDTKARHLYICVANRLFITDTGSKGVLRLEKWGSVTRTLLAGSLLEQGEHVCSDQASMPLVTGLSPTPGGAAGAGAGSAGAGGAGAGAGAGSTAGSVGAGAAAAGGTATAPAAAAAAGAASVGGVGAGTIGIAAGAVGAGSATAAGLTGAFTNSCSTPGGCSNLPLAVSPSAP